jgi:hypothetical protein
MQVRGKDAAPEIAENERLPKQQTTRFPLIDPRQTECY